MSGRGTGGCGMVVLVAFGSHCGPRAATNPVCALRDARTGGFRDQGASADRGAGCDLVPTGAAIAWVRSNLAPPSAERAWARADSSSRPTTTADVRLGDHGVKYRSVMVSTAVSSTGPDSRRHCWISSLSASWRRCSSASSLVCWLTRSRIGPPAFTGRFDRVHLGFLIDLFDRLVGRIACFG